MYFPTLVSPTSIPSLSSSPWIRGAPHNGFSRCIRRMRARTVCRNGRSADAAGPRLPRPEHPETRAMPGNNGVRLDDHQRRSPSRPDPREPYPEEPVGRCQPRSLHEPLQDAQLVTECQDLKLQSRAAAEHQDNGREEGGEHAPGRQSMEEPQLVVYQSDRDLREPPVSEPMKRYWAERRKAESKVK